MDVLSNIHVLEIGYNLFKRYEILPPAVGQVEKKNAKNKF